MCRVVLVWSAITSGRDSRRDAAVSHVVKNEVGSVIQSKASCLLKKKNRGFKARTEVQIRK